MGWQTNKNTGHLVKFGFQINNELVFSIICFMHEFNWVSGVWFGHHGSWLTRLMLKDVCKLLLAGEDRILFSVVTRWIFPGIKFMFYVGRMGGRRQGEVSSPKPTEPDSLNRKTVASQQMSLGLRKSVTSLETPINRNHLHFLCHNWVAWPLLPAKMNRDVNIFNWVLGQCEQIGFPLGRRKRRIDLG